MTACPKDMETLRKLGAELEDTADYVEKDEIWRRILQAEPRDVEALQKLALLRGFRADKHMQAAASPAEPKAASAPPPETPAR
jgi:hypothetical protein